VLADVVKAVEGVKSVRVKKSSLDTVFINLTGASIEGEQTDLRKIYMRVRRARR
jgi:ABC-2 type transport system ATP-binding protein